MINHKSFVHIIRHLKSLSIITAKQPRNIHAKNMSTTTLQYKHQLQKMTVLDKQLAKAMDADPDSAKWYRIWRIRILCITVVTPTYFNHNFFYWDFLASGTVFLQFFRQKELQLQFHDFYSSNPEQDTIHCSRSWSGWQSYFTFM